MRKVYHNKIQVRVSIYDDLLNAHHDFEEHDGLTLSERVNDALKEYMEARNVQCS